MITERCSASRVKRVTAECRPRSSTLMTSLLTSGERFSIALYAAAWENLHYFRLHFALVQRKAEGMAEDRVKSKGTNWFWLGLYGVGALVTLLFQLYVRSSQCAPDCALSYAKAAMWSLIWPASWIVYLAGIVFNQ